MHVHLVLVTKYRRCVLDGEAIETLRHIFSKVCADFESELVQMDGEKDHVHLLVNYPPKVSVSSLGNSLKGVSSYVLRRILLLEKCSLVAFLLRRVVRRRTTGHNQTLR
jgi:putative transposase